MTGKSNSEGNSSHRGQWSNQDRLDAGMAAAQALNSPILNIIYNMMMQENWNQYLMSEPKEENLRRSLYYEQKAIQTAFQKMAALVADAQRVAEENNLANDPAEQERQKMEQQGFGLNFNQGAEQ